MPPFLIPEIFTKSVYSTHPVDRPVKEKLRVKHYTRYMDDIVLLHPDRDFPRKCLKSIREICDNELKHTLNDKTQIFPMAHGADYLCWHFYLTDTGKVVKRLRTQNKKKQQNTGLCAGGGDDAGDVQRSANDDVCRWTDRNAGRNAADYLRHE